MIAAAVTSALSVFLASQFNLSFAQQNTQPTLVEPAFQIPLNKLPLDTFDSPDRNFTAIVCPDDKYTYIYRVNWKGNMGLREKMPMWKVQDCFEEVWISNDGQSIAGTKLEKGILPSIYAKDATILSFYGNGQLISQVTLAQMTEDPSGLPKTASGYRLIKDIYLSEMGKLVVEIADGRNLLFEMSTGKNSPTDISKRVQANWKVFRDIRRGFEFQYPDNYVINPENSTNPITTDFLFKDSMGWLFSFSIEEARDSEERRILASTPFEDFAVERTKLMYQADGADSSQYATDAVKKTAFKTRNNLNAVEFYLAVVNEMFSENSHQAKTEKRTEGPIYAVSISQRNENPRLIVIRLIDERSRSTSEKEMLRKIVDTVRVLR